MHEQNKNGGEINGLLNITTNFTSENSNDFRRLTGLFLNLRPKDTFNKSYFWREIDECENLIKGLEHEINKWLRWTTQFEVHDKQESFLVHLETKTFRDLLYNRLHYIKYIEKEIESRKNEFYAEQERLQKIDDEQERIRKLPKIEE